jgi:hypothetical protein
MATQVTLNSGAVSSAGSLKLQTNGTTDAVTIDTAQNVGIGVTPSAWSGAVPRAMQVGVGSYIASNTDGTLQLGANGYYNGSNFIYTSTAYAGRYAISTSTGAHAWLTAPSGTAGNSITFTQAMTLDASGNLGVGTTSPAGRLHVVGNTYAQGDIYFNTATAQISSGSGAWPLIFGINGTEKARIDSSGNLLVGKTSSAAAGNGTVVYGGQGRVDITQSNNSAVMSFFNSGNSNNQSGYIYITGASTQYVTSSDYRLKENIAPMTGALAKVMALNPVTYKWKADGSDGEGFIAHELQQVCPNSVAGEKDAVDEDGNPKYQGIDTSFLVATLTAAIQEQQAIITSLTARIEALETK